MAGVKGIDFDLLDKTLSKPEKKIILEKLVRLHRMTKKEAYDLLSTCYKGTLYQVFSSEIL